MDKWPSPTSGPAREARVRTASGWRRPSQERRLGGPHGARRSYAPALVLHVARQQQQRPRRRRLEPQLDEPTTAHQPGEPELGLLREPHPPAVRGPVGTGCALLHGRGLEHQAVWGPGGACQRLRVAPLGRLLAQLHLERVELLVIATSVDQARGPGVELVGPDEQRLFGRRLVRATAQAQLPVWRAAEH